jgi:TonB family protein
MNADSELPHVYTAGEIARAAGVRVRDVRDLVDAGTIEPIGRFFAVDAAVLAVRVLRGVVEPDRTLFRPAPGFRRQPGVPLALSGTLHAGFVAAFVLLTLGMAKPDARIAPEDRNEMRLVFLVSPGPGGGGGGGGHRDPAPPPPAERKGVAALRSPLPARRPPSRAVAVKDVPPPRVEPQPAPRPVEPAAVKAEPAPPVVAPVVPVAADPRDLAGVPWRKDPAVTAESHGPGAGGGTGTGRGTGLGEGDGAGIGPGSGGGTGGGPYRPGSGVEPPKLLREVKADYTEDARRRGISGDVVLEIVVRRDGTVGDVRMLQGLGGGLDQRAVQAVRQWKFDPARRKGVPVDVLVEVAVEFMLR